MNELSIILRKARFSDWPYIYKNVWSRPECARYMFWNVTDGAEAAQIRMERTIEYQKANPGAFFICRSDNDEAIGFAGVKMLSETMAEESGICLSSDYWHRGLGKEVLRRLMSYARDVFCSEVFIYHTREDNIPSVSLAESMGFTLERREPRVSEKDRQTYYYLVFRRSLD
ncbi:MAG: GNAT family N-acetyltransferase [Oscillospiraceae bacterium]|nr:GNAT family N-acetyltransferase [Oscillospiraceae bacterium]